MGERRVHFVLFCKGKRDTSATPNFGKACQNLVISILLLKGLLTLIHLSRDNPVNYGKPRLYVKNVNPSPIMRYHTAGFRMNG